MKKFVFLIIIGISLMPAYAQMNVLTLSGGYTFANIENTDVNADGWRINGLYEFNPYENKLTHGFSFGYMNLKASSDESGILADYTINTIPLYYAPKYTFGESKLKGYVKGALGGQFSNIKRTGTLAVLEDNDIGILLGAGLGGMYDITDNIFINLEYELFYMTNSYYRDGLINTASLGLGFKF